MNTLDEAAFLLRMREFLACSYGPGVAAAGPDDDLVGDAGLGSLQLIALFGFIENLRGRELEEVPELERLTLRILYSQLYLDSDTRGEDVLRK